MMVVGGGSFGSRAIRVAMEAKTDVVVIDSDPECEAAGLVEYKVEDVTSVEGSSLLIADWRTHFREIFETYRPSWTVPAVPGHMLGMVALDELVDRHGLVGFPHFGGLGPLTPHVVLEDLSFGLLVTSFMHGGRCQTDCGQPAVCPITGEERPVPMHSLMDALLGECADRHDVLVTSDIGGVGAIAFDDLRSCLSNIDRIGQGEVYGISTSCRCHAVANLLSVP